MTDRYLKSGATGAADGTSWTDAYTALTTAIAAMAAGDRLFISNNHSETGLTAQTYNSPGTFASPCQFLCADDSAGPPTTLATGASWDGSAAGMGYTFNGEGYWYGCQFTSHGSSTNNFYLANDSSSTAVNQFFESCSFQFTTGAGSSSQIRTQGSNQTGVSRVFLKNCTYRFVNASNFFNICGYVRIIGGSFISGTTTPTTLFGLNQTKTGHDFVCSGLDFSNLAATVDLLQLSGTQAGSSIIRNCKLPASWSGTLSDSTPTGGNSGEMHNCDSTDTNYRLWKETYTGSVKHETTLVKTGGASDGTTGLSWNMTSGSQCIYPHQTLMSPEIHSEWNSTTGSSITVTVDFLHDSATNLQDDEIWLEVQYLGTSGFPLSLFVTDGAAALATPADQTTSGATWTTTGMSNPNEQKLSVTFTPQEEGVVVATVHVAKASYTVYVDPVAQLS